MSEEDTTVLSDNNEVNLFEDENDKKSKRSRRLVKHDSNKKRRLTVSAFLDTEAQVGDDEEDNYEDDFLLQDESTEAEKLENRSRLKRLQEGNRLEDRRIGGTGYLETAIDKLAKRYQDQTFEEGEDEEPEQVQYDDIEETSALMPDFGDPKLWIIRTARHSSDRNLAISLLNKFLKLQDDGKNLGVYSCFVPDGVSGYLYVEADSKSAVTDALAEFRQVNLSTVKMVPLNEMPSVFTTGIENIYIPLVGEYVRVKFGKYAGDLAQVFETDELNSVITIKLIPRLDDSVSGIDHDPDLATRMKETVLRSKSRRSPKKFFDRERVELSGGFIEQGIIPGTYRYQGMTFQESGHVLMRMNAKRLITGDSVNATLTELKEFNIDTNITDTHSIPITQKKTTHLYKLGERVRVTRGELVSIVGKIISIDDEEVEIEPDNKEVPHFKINRSCVIKHFTEGDNVRAIGGMNEGETGLIALINEQNKTAVVFSPQSGQEFKCGLEYLTLIPKESQCNNDYQFGALNGYCVGDLVQISSGNVGVIVSIDRVGMFTVLSEDGNKIRCTTAQVVCKRSSFGHSCHDFNRQPIELKSRALVVKGHYKHKSGQVQHLWKNILFISLEGGDMISVPAECCLSTAVSANIEPAQKEKIASKKLAVYKKPALLGKTVKILQGRHKGLLGDIVHVEPGQFTILLKVKPKTVRCRKEDCVVMDNWHTYIRQQRQRGSTNITSSGFEKTSYQPQSTPQQPATQSLMDWAIRGVCVEITGVGTYQGKMGIIGEVFDTMADTNLQVLHVHVGDDYIAIAAESVVPLKPRNTGDLALAYKKSKDEAVTLLAINDETATLQAKNGDIFDAPLDEIALFTQTV